MNVSLAGGLEQRIFCRTHGGLGTMPRRATSNTFRFPTRLWLHNIFLQWRTYTLQVIAIGLRTETLQRKLHAGPEANSIWHMHKKELVLLAQVELGISFEEANRETVVVLRELIRRSRDAAKEQKDPLDSLPKGLDKMNHAQLMDECIMRGIDVEAIDAASSSTKVPSKKTRPQMILDIREYVALRHTCSQMTRPRPTTMPTSSTARVFPDAMSEDEL